jgi:hypothetical protein
MRDQRSTADPVAGGSGELARAISPSPPPPPPLLTRVPAHVPADRVDPHQVRSGPRRRCPACPCAHTARSSPESYNFTAVWNAPPASLLVSWAAALLAAVRLRKLSHPRRTKPSISTALRWLRTRRATFRLPRWQASTSPPTPRWWYPPSRTASSRWMAPAASLPARCGRGLCARAARRFTILPLQVPPTAAPTPAPTAPTSVPSAMPTLAPVPSSSPTSAPSRVPTDASQYRYQPSLLRINCGGGAFVDNATGLNWIADAYFVSGVPASMRLAVRVSRGTHARRHGLVIEQRDRGRGLPADDVPVQPVHGCLVFDHALAALSGASARCAAPRAEALTRAARSPCLTATTT